MTNTIPVLTEEKRQALIAFNRAIITQHEAYAVPESGWPDDVRMLVESARIALASLEAKGKTMRRAKDDDRTWVECGKDYYLGRTFYSAPPVPALKPINLYRGVKRHVVSCMSAEDTEWYSKRQVEELIKMAGYGVTE